MLTYPWRKVFWTTLILANVCTGISLKTAGSVSIIFFFMASVFVGSMIVSGSRYNNRSYNS